MIPKSQIDESLSNGDFPAARGPEEAKVSTLGTLLFDDVMAANNMRSLKMNREQCDVYK
jgi:hypothetical protein